MRRFKRTIALTIATVFLLFQSALALPPLGGNKLVASGVVTKANMKISAVAAGSFVDFADANKLQPYTGCLLEIADSSGRKIKGYIGADGTGETLGADVLGGEGNFASSVGWTLPAGFSIAGGKFVVTATAGYGFKSFGGLTPYALYRGDCTVDSITPGQASIGLNGYVTEMVPSRFTTTGAKVGYATQRNAATESIGIYISPSTTTCQIDDLTIKQVTAPSATGVLITNDKAGTAQSFAAKDSSFNYYNDSSNYTYKIYRTPPVVVDSDAVLNANATIVLTDGSAAWAAAGIDDSAFMDDRHIVHISDSSGRVAFGYYKSGGAGNVVNTKGGATQNWIYKHPDFSTAGDFVRKIYRVGD